MTTPRTIVDIHILQTVPPSNVNRDDTGSPKTAIYGGVRRARVSSQAWKRATRKEFRANLDPHLWGVRTKRIVEEVAKRIVDNDAGLADQAEKLAADVIKKAGIELEKKPRKKSTGEEENHEESKYLVLLSNLQMDQLAREAVHIGRSEDPAAALKAFKGKDVVAKDHSIDLVLFGRMVADVKDLNVDACCQVAHAISVHGVETEYDYFTAVDDAKAESEDEDAGAGMIGTVEFNSSTLYRYATIDVDRLQESLGSAPAARQAVEEFIKAFARSMPTGKQNTFANRTLPDAVVVQVRDDQPVNLVGAFEDAVRPTKEATRLEVAAERLGAHATAVAETWGAQPVAAWATTMGAAEQGLHATLKDTDWIPFPALPEAVGRLVEERLGASA